MRPWEMVALAKARLWALVIVVVAGAGLLLWHLWHEQIRLGEQHARTIGRQSIRRIRLAPVRGRIFSQDGQVVCDNQPEFNVNFHLHELRQPGRHAYQRTIDFAYEQMFLAAGILQRPLTIRKEAVTRHIRAQAPLPFQAFRMLDEAELARLEEYLPPIPGIDISTDSRRLYPLGDAGAHLLGFVGRRQFSAEESKRFAFFEPEKVGRQGLEAARDTILAGLGGERQVRVDISGFVHQEYSGPELPPVVPGSDLVLTLDSRAQILAQSLLRGNKGALVLLDCQSGAVLAMVSSPSYDPNLLDETYYQELATNERERPLLNRALSAGYTPGSIIKPIVALSLLANKKVESATQVECPGYFRVGSTRIRCNARQGHGWLDLPHALEASCNTWFIANGVALGVDALGPDMALAGVGQAPAFELRTGGGMVPSREGKLRRFGQPWGSGDTAHVSIGQGLILISPLQAALWCAALANGGKLLKPYLVAEIHHPDGTRERLPGGLVVSHLPGTPEDLAVVREGMYLVVHGERATAPDAQSALITLAGKTGTAEIGSRDQRRQNTWFIAFGPWEDPRYAIAVLVEDGQSGGRSAAPIARQFFERWLPQLDP